MARQTISEAVEHQNYPIEALLYQLGMEASEKDFPLFDVALVLENVQDKKYINHIPLNMIFSFNKTGNSIKGEVEYNSALYSPVTVKRIIKNYSRLLGEALDNLDTPVTDLEILLPSKPDPGVYSEYQTWVHFPQDIFQHKRHNWCMPITPTLSIHNPIKSD